MDWEVVGAIAEAISAVAVVVSLIYLALQVRQNTRIARAATIQSWAQTSAIEKQALFESEEFAALLLRAGADRASL